VDRSYPYHKLDSFHGGPFHPIDYISVWSDGQYTNFTAEEFQSFCKEQGVMLNYASVAHPQSNGQVEKANGLVCSGIKKRLLVPLKRAAGAWVEELDAVL
jgi:transposase InsO family protein